MTKKQSTNEKEREILKKLQEGMEPEPEVYRGVSEQETPSETAPKAKRPDRVCPKCGKETEYTTLCPNCGYRGYMPFSDDKIKRVRRILYPVILVLFLIVYLFIRGYLHF